MLIRAKQVHNRNPNRNRRRNNLVQVAIDEAERGAQRLMAGNDMIESFLKRLHIERAFKAKGNGDIVGMILWTYLIQKPKALLNEGDRQMAFAAYALKLRLFLVDSSLRGYAESLRQNGNCWRFKQGRYGQLHVKAFTDA